jgi:hypothetical protein
MGKRRRRRPEAIWLRNSVNGWNVALRDKKPKGPVTVTRRDGVTSVEELGALVGTRIFRGKTYFLYPPLSTAHPYRTQYVRHFIRANAFGALTAISPHY